MKIIFPRPFAIAIDDLGWINGHNEGEEGYGPYRLGINRRMSVKDYAAVVDLAKKAGVRLQGLFILGEMDRENFLGSFPTTTHMRHQWNNSPNISSLQVEMMEYVKEQAAWLEFGLHGVGHEFWPADSVRRRAEWYNTVDDHPWPENDIREHLICFQRIMRQYGLSQENGHSFPESFVPCAYSYYWNPEGAYSLGSVLNEFGVKFANTDFSKIPECDPPSEPNGGGFDHRVHVMNRYNYGNLWYELGKLPTTPLGEQPTDFIETHWPNLLAQDDFLQADVTRSWTDYYLQVQRTPDRYCAKNTHQMHSQWLYKKHTQISEERDGLVIIDNQSMPSLCYQGTFPGNLVVKVPLGHDQHVSEVTLDGLPIPGIFETEGYAHLYLPRLLQKKYVLEYKIGKHLPSQIVWHQGTGNIFETTLDQDSLRLDVGIYGSQELFIYSSREPKNIRSNNPQIEVIDWKQLGDKLLVQVKAHDIQGETGCIEVLY